jgi:four helix bundle protein
VADFRDLRAWQESVRLAVLSRDAIRKLPASERFALADQWRRAAYGVSLNIAEGASRRGPKEFRRYLDIARSPLHEIEAILALVQALQYLTGEDLAAVTTVWDNCARMVYGLLRAMAVRGERTT